LVVVLFVTITQQQQHNGLFFFNFYVRAASLLPNAFLPQLTHSTFSFFFLIHLLTAAAAAVESLKLEPFFYILFSLLQSFSSTSSFSACYKNQLSVQ